MKLSIIIVSIVTLLITILSPFSLQVSLADSDAPYIAKLNVCHTGAAFLSGGIDVLYLFDSESIQHNPVSRFEISYLLYADLFIPLQEEKPPRS